LATLAELWVLIKSNSDDLNKGLDGAKKNVGSFSTNATKLIGGAVAGAAVAAGAAILAIGKGAFDVSVETEAAANQMAASLGLPIEEAEKFAEVAKRVYGNNFAESVGDAAIAVEGLAKQLGLSAEDPALQTMAENAFRLRDVFGVEVADSIDAVTTLTQQFGISNTEAFDLLAKGYQTGLDRSGDFLDTIGEYSVQFAEGGASAVEFFSALDTGLQGGMLGTDKAADAFKEFRVRIQDGSKLTAESLTAIGLSAEEITTGLANGSITTKDAWDLVQAALLKTKDTSVQFQAGVGLIGTQFEDLGAKTILAMDLTEDWADGGLESISKLDAKYNTFGGAVEGIWRRLTVSVSPFTDKILNLINDAMPKVMEAFDAFDANVGPAMEAVGTVIGNVVTAVQGFFGQFKNSVTEDGNGPIEYWKEWIDTNLPLVQTLFENILGAIQGFWALFGDDIMHIVQNTFDTAFLIIDTVMRTIGDLITLSLQLLTGDWEGAGQTLEGIVTRIWDTITAVVTNKIDSIMTLFTAIDWGELGRSIIEGIANGISSAAGKIAEAAEDAARDAYEAAKDWLGISSPSKKTEKEIGKPFAEGIGKGIEDSMRGLSGSVNSGLGGLMNGITTPSFAGVGGGGMNITVNVSGDNATYEGGRAVGRGIQDELRRRGA
jgi:hypothetical protein